MIEVSSRLFEQRRTIPCVETLDQRARGIEEIPKLIGIRFQVY